MAPIIPMHVDFRTLQHAAALAGEQSFAKAAKVLHLSQPALSRSIIELEKRLGEKLFDRSIGSVTPTEFGRLYLRHAEGILDRARAMDQDLQQHTNRHEGELRIGAGVYPADLFLGDALGAFSSGTPGFRVQVLNDQARDLIKLLRKRELDLLVGDLAWHGGADDIATIPLRTHQGYAAVRHGHPLLRKRRITLDMILDLPLVSSEAAASVLAAMASKAADGSETARRLGRWMPTVAVESIAMMCATAAQSDCVALLPLPIALDEVQRGRLAIVPLVLPWLKVTFGVMHLAHRPLTAEGAALVAAIRKADDIAYAAEARAAAALPS